MPERHREIRHVLATSKPNTASVFEEVHSLKADTYSPEALSGLREPTGADPFKQAAWKDRHTKLNLDVNPEEKVVVHSADTVYHLNGEHHSKPGEARKERLFTPVPLDADNHEAYIREAIEWYQDPFMALWSNAFIYHAWNTRNAAAVLEVEAQFSQGIHEDFIRNNYDPKMNTRIPLMERISDFPEEATLRVSNRGQGERMVISPLLGLQIVRDRVLTPEWLEEMRSQPTDRIIRDQWDLRRRLVTLSLTSALNRE